MKKWIMGCGMALALGLIAAGGAGYFAYTKLRTWNAQRIANANARQVLVDSGINQRRQYLERNLSQETRDTIPLDFYTYDGLRDWWRMPLVFPYQLLCIDTKSRAYLQKYNPKYTVKEPSQSTSGLLDGITRMATDQAILLFERRTGAAISYGILEYGSGTQSECRNVEQLWSSAKKAGYSGPQALLSIEDMFTRYYHYEKAFLEPSPAADAHKAAPPE